MSAEKISDVLVDQNRLKCLVNQNQYFTHELETIPDVSNQKQSGRCWMFADLTFYRTTIINKYKLDKSFDFSTSWLFFYHKLEKFRRSLLLLQENPDLRKSNSNNSLKYGYCTSTGDGGYMGDTLNLIEKYGIIPKEAYGESNNTEKTSELNGLVRRLLKVYAYRMQLTDDEKLLELLVEQGIAECRNLLELCLGVPPSQFTWQYRGNDDMSKSREIKHSSAPFKRKYYEIQEYTPVEFWEMVKYSAKHNLSRVSLVNDPLKNIGVHVASIPECTNVYENMRHRTYITATMDVILEYVKNVIREGLPVILHCGVGTVHDFYYNSNLGVMDNGIFDYEDLCPSLKGFDNLKDKVSSQMESVNHAMCIVGYNKLNNTWKIQNSWGKERGYSGYWLATTEWFHARICLFNIPLTLLSEEHQELAKSKTTDQVKLDDPY